MELDVRVELRAVYVERVGVEINDGVPDSERLLGLLLATLDGVACDDIPLDPLDGPADVEVEEPDPGIWLVLAEPGADSDVDCCCD